MILCDSPRRTPLSTHPEELAAGFLGSSTLERSPELVPWLTSTGSPHVPTVRLEPGRISSSMGRVLIKVV